MRRTSRTTAPSSATARGVVGQKKSEETELTHREIHSRPSRVRRWLAQAGERLEIRQARKDMDRARAVRERSDDNPMLTRWLISLSVLLLVVLGIMMVWSASSVTSVRRGGSIFADLKSQVLYVGIGVIAAFIMARVPMALLRRIAGAAYVIALVMQYYVYAAYFFHLPGNKGEIGGNIAWIGVGPFSLQPSEILKVVFALWFAVRLVDLGGRIREGKVLIRVCAEALIGPIGIIALGKDLGSGAVILMMFGVGLLVANIRANHAVLLGLAGMVSLGILVVAGGNNRLARVLEPFGLGHGDDKTSIGKNAQRIHGDWAFGSGGLTGVGLGSSREKWGYLPAAHNDFIFAIIGEELGLGGTLTILALFAVLGYGIFRLIRRHRDPVVKLCAAMIGTWIIGQAAVNMLATVGGPIIGLPLPFISAGGSALLGGLVAIGLLMNFTRTEPGVAAALESRPSMAARTRSVISGGSQFLRTTTPRPRASASQGRQGTRRRTHTKDKS